MLLIIISHISCTQSHNLFLTPIDTLYLPAQPLEIRTFYSFTDTTQVNTYFHFDENRKLYFNYCVNAVLPTISFPLKGLIGDYLIDEGSKLLIRYPQKNYFERIDSTGAARDTLFTDFGEKNDEAYTMDSFDFAFSCPILDLNNITKKYYTYTFLQSQSNYAINKVSREQMLSEKLITELTEEHQFLKATRRFGDFPQSFNSNSTLFSYNFDVAMNKDTVFLLINEIFDSIFVICLDGSTKTHFMKSKYQNHKHDYIDKSRYLDNFYLDQIAMEKVMYIFILYDSYRNLYYIVVGKSAKHVNKDGTINDPYDKPWSLMVLNEQFEQLAEIDMPDHLSKHEIMIVPEGIAIQDNNLSDDNRACFVIFNVKWKN